MITIASTSPKEPVPPLVKIREVAALLSMSRHTVHHLIQAGDLNAALVNPTAKGRKPGRKHVRVTRKSLFKFYEKRFGHTLNRALLNPFES